MADPTNLPPEILANIAAKKLGLQNQMDTSLQNLGNQYNDNMYQLDQFNNDTTRKINDNFASSGLFNSGIRVDEQGRLQRNVGERRGALENAFATGKSGIQNQYDAALQDLISYQNTQAGAQTQNTLQQQLADAQNNLAAQQQAALAGGGAGGGAPAMSQSEQDLLNLLLGQQANPGMHFDPQNMTWVPDTPGTSTILKRGSF